MLFFIDMVKHSVIVWFLLLSFLTPGIAWAGMADESAFYHFGVFDYEDGDYKNAEIWLRKALSQNPDNPYYNHWIGRTLMKTDRFALGLVFLENAWKHDRTIPGLKTDLAYSKYRVGAYSEAVGFFREIVGEDPENAFAHYYAGMSLFRLGRYQDALTHFSSAGQNQSALLTNCRFVSGICRYKTKDFDTALEDFEYARDHADSDAFKEKAEEWIDAIRKRNMGSRPFGIWFRAAGVYDDNVRLEDRDIQSDAEDYATQVFVSGHYDFIDSNTFRTSIGYGHYQSFHRDLDEYDLTGVMPHLAAKFVWQPIVFELGYYPAWYSIDSESYLESHAAKSRLFFKIGENARAGLSYAYATEDYSSDDGRDGDRQKADIDFDFDFTGHGTFLFGTAGVEDYSAEYSDYPYFKIMGTIGFLVNLPMNFSFRIAGQYEDKKYDNEHSAYGVRRNDDKFAGSLKITRTFLDGLASVSAEYDHTENDSNFVEKNYTRNRVTLSTEFEY